MATRQQKRQLWKSRHFEQKRLKGKGQPRSKKYNKKTKPWSPVKMKMFTFHSPFHSDVSQEKRLEVIRMIGAKAKKDFNEKYPTLEKWFQNYDSLYILSFCSLYFVSHPEGIDPEATGKLDFPHHFLEILQAFALSKERKIDAKPLLDKANDLQKEMKEIGELMMIRHLDIPNTLKSNDEIHAYKLRTEMMASTTAVRNWAYYHQIKRVVLDLAKLIDLDFKKIYKIGSFDFFEILFKLTEERNDILNEHLNKVRGFIKFRKSNYKELMRAYNLAFPENIPIAEEEFEDLWEASQRNMEHLTNMLIFHSDLKLKDIYTFPLKHAESMLRNENEKKPLKNILDKISFKFGDLKNHNKEHIILDNPVSHHPFIKIENNLYFSAIWGALSHFLLDIFEDLIWEDKNLKEKYTDLKSQYLESETEKIFRTGFPNATILRGSMWQDTTNNTNYENDLIVLIDSFAIVVEEKSGIITDPAKRGAPERLFETLKRLIEEPSEQALRFINLLKSENKIFNFKTKSGSVNSIDSNKIKYYIPLGVTFSNLGMIGSNIKKLLDAKIVNKPLEELAPSMSFTDLEIIFQLLDLESERIHYLARRREIEAHLDYEGDELDLLGIYLDNGFNIGDVEYSKDTIFNISLKSKELDPYIIGKNEGVTLPKPTLVMTNWWKDILNRIAEKKFPNWIEISFILLNSTKDDQEKFEHAFKKLSYKVLSGKVIKPHNWVVLFSGPERRRYLIAGYPYITDQKSLRDTIIDEIIHEEKINKIRGSVVIGVNLKYKDYPYSVFAKKLSTDLFDTLTL